jgi:hypothetical protein
MQCQRWFCQNCISVHDLANQPLARMSYYCYRGASPCLIANGIVYFSVRPWSLDTVKTQGPPKTMDLRRSRFSPRTSGTFGSITPSLLAFTKEISRVLFNPRYISTMFYASLQKGCKDRFDVSNPLDPRLGLHSSRQATLGAKV